MFKILRCSNVMIWNPTFAAKAVTPLCLWTTLRKNVRSTLIVVCAFGLVIAFFQILVDINYVKISWWQLTFGTNIIRDVNIAVAAAPSLPFSSTLVTIVKVDCETRRRTWAPPRAPPRPPGDLGWWCRCSRRAQGGQAASRFATTGTCVAPSGKVCCNEQCDRNWKQ